jgi:RNA polymerase-interacting CarD/CdnL/TRCF family regulator
LTKLFEQTFRNKNYMTFISKSYLSTLDSISKLQYLESQIAYAKTHQSILLRNIKDTHVPSIHTTTNNKQKLLTQCLTEIKDYQGKPLFLQIFPPVNNTVEAHVLNNNLSLAHQWEQNSVSHVARLIERTYYPKVFDLSYDELNNITPSSEQWSIPAAPEIDFLVSQRKIWTTQIPKTIQKHADKQFTTHVQGKSTQSVHNTSQKTDTHTAVTTTTDQSDNTDIISDLQDESRQHAQHIEDHNNRLNIISQQIEELQELQAWSTRILNLETKYKQIFQQNDDINTELNTVTNISIPNIIATITGQRQIITHTSS